MTCWAVSLISEELIFLCIWCLKGREKEERNVIRKEIFKYIEFWWLVVSHWFNGSTANQSVSSYIRLRRERERENEFLMLPVVVQQTIFFFFFIFCVFLLLFYHFLLVLINMSQLLQSIIDWLRGLFFKVNKI